MKKKIYKFVDGNIIDLFIFEGDEKFIERLEDLLENNEYTFSYQTTKGIKRHDNN